MAVVESGIADRILPLPLPPHLLTLTRVLEGPNEHLETGAAPSQRRGIYLFASRQRAASFRGFSMLFVPY